MCEKSFSEDRLIKSHIKTNHPGKVMHFGEEINFKMLMFHSFIRSFIHSFIFNVFLIYFRESAERGRGRGEGEPGSEVGSEPNMGLELLNREIVT